MEVVETVEIKDTMDGVDTKGYRKLLVVKEGIKLIEMVYRLTKSFPPNELYGIVSQLRRAAVSVPTNIVEGYARASNKEFMNFLNIAYASLVEVEFLLELSLRLDYINDDSYKEIEYQRRRVAVYLVRFRNAVKKNN